MIKIEALIHPYKLDDVKLALDTLGIEGIILSDVFDHGCGEGHKAFYRGAEYRMDAARTKLEMIVSSLRVEEVVDALLRAARTANPGDDGKILLYEVADAIQIKTGARLELALF